MGHFSGVASAVVVLLLTGGCSFFAGDEEDIATPVQPSEIQPSETVISSKPRSTRIAAALIPPTNPDQRLRTIRSGRTDPFAALVSPRQSPSAAGASGESGATGSAGSTNSQNGSGTGSSTSSTSSGGATSSRGGSGASAASRPTVVRAPSLPLPELSPSGSHPLGLQPPATLPPLPQPDLAKQVQVTGIAFVGSIPRAIIKAPNETVSRSVGSGDRLSHGQILVKRIDTSNPDEPVVILEQYGTEVAVGVGKAPIQLASAATDARGLPAVPALWYGK